jgi:hypothetical protein
MTEIPPSIDDDEEDEDDEQTSVLSPELVSAKSSLLARCKVAGLEVEDKFLPGEELQVVRVSMKCGRETRKISLLSEATIKSFLSVPFEKYGFISGIEAICSYDLGTIEAAVRPISNSNAPSSFIWRRFFGVDSSEKLESAKLDMPPGSEGLPHIELSLASTLFSKIVRGVGPVRRMTLKLSGVTAKTHDSALELLNKISGSLFFQLDMLSGVPLTLERERRRTPGTRTRRASGGVEDLQYPRVQYDKAPLSLYWYGRSAEGMPLLQYLAFYQAIEFYFPVYSRSEAQRKLKVILKDPTFRSDRDTDIARLLSAIYVSRTGAFGDERSQLRATLMECCDSEELRSFLEGEPSRKEFFSSKSRSQPYHRIQFANPSVDIRNDVAERVYEIRCKIVHTKTDSRDSALELLLPFSAEAEQLSHDIELVQYLANRVLVSSSTSFSIHPETNEHCARLRRGGSSNMR